jgi:hypothetical protein
MMRPQVAAALAALAIGCASDVSAPDGSIDASSQVSTDASVEACTASTIELTTEVAHTLDARCDVVLVLREPRIVELSTDGAAVRLGDREGSDLGPLRLEPGDHPVRIPEHVTLTVRDLGPAPGELRIARSLTWTDPALLDASSVVGLGRVMQTAAGGEHGGLLLAQLFARFASTAHSERLGPQRLLAAFAADHGDDPRAWDLDAMPFVVTGVHNRVDLASDSHCGELRVSFASTHPLYRPFHLIVLYRQEPMEGDWGADGRAHCAATALRWARLSALDGRAFLEAARARLDETLTSASFLAIESLEFIISPWEWRQWFLRDNEAAETRGELPRVPDNRPLFQTLDPALLDPSRPDRGEALRWIEANAAALSARSALIPEHLRSPSARVNDGVPWVPLDLSGLDPSVAAAYPTLRQQIELTGCPGCHATDADFVQTRPDRTFSPFYTRELDARLVRLRAQAEGRATPAPHGPLQPDPRLPP